MSRWRQLGETRLSFQRDSGGSVHGKMHCYQLGAGETFGVEPFHGKVDAMYVEALAL